VSVVPELQIERDHDAVDTVHVSGEVDMATAPRLRSVLDGLIDGGSTTVVLDCRELSFLDSSGIGVLVAARTRMGDAGELVLVSPPANVRKVLEITGVTGHLTVR
jgi:anti-sigma B factor antagonist